MMIDYIQILLEQHGPCLSSELIARMESEGISSAAARQRVARSHSVFIRLAGIKFYRNARFIYLDEQYGSKDYWQGLERAFFSHGKAYWSAMIGLAARGGRYPENLFPIVCGAPDKRRGQLSPKIILDRLVAVKVLEIEETEGDSPRNIKFRPQRYSVNPDRKMKAVLMAENVALNAIKNWARSIGLGSYDRFLIRGDEELPIVSGVAWDLSAPSYMRPLANIRRGKLRPGFLVCDLYLDQIIDVQEVDLFVRKYDMAASPTNVSPIMALLVGDEFTSAAFDKAKSLGVLPVTIENLFGEPIKKALKDLIKLLSDTGETAAVNPEHLEKVMTKLSSIEGASNNLRAALFELVVANLIKDVQNGYVKTGIKKRDHETSAEVEIDVLWEEPEKKKVVIVECKAKIPGSQVGLKEVTHWYSNRIPLIHKILKHDPYYSDYEFDFQIWTNGRFHPASQKWLGNQDKVLDDYTVDWKSGTELKEYADKASGSEIKKILKEHYFKNASTVLFTSALQTIKN